VSKSRISPLGTRVELTAMDPHCDDISIGLYLQVDRGRPEYLVHTYRQLPEADARIAFLKTTLQTIADLRPAGDRLHFTCEAVHLRAARRAFLEACKQNTPALSPRPLVVLDKKSGLTIRVRPLGQGHYQVEADGPDHSDRAESVASGLCKLGELSEVANQVGQISFPCGHAHDALLALLLPRALNVRMTLREEEAAATRGLLVAPSQQK
jgi:hypothetical protein